MDGIEIEQIDQLWQMHAAPATWAALLDRLDAALPDLTLREQLRLAPVMDRIEAAAGSRKSSAVMQVDAAVGERIAALAGGTT